MDVAYDSYVVANSWNCVSITTASFTIAAVANRVAILSLHPYLSVDNPTSITGSCGGQAGAAIANTDETYEYNRVLLFGVIAPAPGSQTATMSWTGTSSNILGALVFNGAAQTTPFTGGQKNIEDSSNPASVTITSASGDRTVSAYVGERTGPTSNQTKVFEASRGHIGCGDYGSGTGNTTHSWTPTGATNQVVVGCNVVQYTAVGGLSIPVAMHHYKMLRAA